MTRATDITAMNCTSCGAGLNIYGGGRVVVHVCSYCGAELDAQDDYKTLKTFANCPRPDSPFQIGMNGIIHGISFTVIGTMQMMEQHRGSVWTWIDHQIYSPTHGYAILTVENGHLNFTRRYRKSVSSWIGVNRVEAAEYPPTVRAGRDSFKYFETSTSEVIFVEGEFNWAPQITDTDVSVTAMSDDAMLSFAQSTQENEVYHTTYLDPTTTYSAFGIDAHPKAVGVHPLQPFTPHRSEGFFRRVTTNFAVLAGLLGLYIFASFPGERIGEQRFSINRLPAEYTFQVTKPNRVVQVDLWGKVDNSWAYIVAEVTDPEGVPLFEAGRTVEFYHGRDSGGSWSEGRSTKSFSFVPKTSGEYTIEILIEEEAGWGSNGKAVAEVQVSISQGIMRSFWVFVVFIVVFLPMAAFMNLRPFLHHRKRWAKSDWTED